MDPGAASGPGRALPARTDDHPAIAELRLSGRLDLTRSPALRDQLSSLLRHGSGRLVLDLSGVTHCDASGLAVLVGTSRQARRRGGWLRLAAVPPSVEEVLRRTGLHRHLIACTAGSPKAEQR